MSTARKLSHVWLEFDSLVNARDVGGIPTPDGPVKSQRLIRSDNLQALTEADIAQLQQLGVSDVVDLRSTYELASEGPGPLAGRGVAIHHHSFLPERHDNVHADESKQDVIREALATGDHQHVGAPARRTRVDTGSDDRFSGSYVAYLLDRPESVLAALRVIAHAPGASLVHCAAGKDRTGTTVALALSIVGADREAIIADYAASSERMQLILDRLMSTETYRPNLEGTPLERHLTRPESMRAVLAHLDEHYGGPLGVLDRMGWTTTDTEAMQHKLLA